MAKSAVLALACVVVSTCFVHWIILQNWGRLVLSISSTTVVEKMNE